MHVSYLKFMFIIDFHVIATLTVFNMLRMVGTLTQQKTVLSEVQITHSETASPL